MGHQPMVHGPSGDVLTYNGELYNFRELRDELERLGERFRGQSDTEVLLAALVRWGPAALSKFRGMFAIAWYRKAQRALVLARDPLGIKPLYVARADGGLVAASEVRALLATGLVPRRIDRRGLATFLAFGAVQEPDTIIEGVKAFPAGCWQSIPIDSPWEAASPTRYWRPPAVDAGITEHDAIERLRRSLDRSVREHLISDVPAGIFLSSGIDSTVVAGLASRHSIDVRTFTVGFEEHADMSESGPASRTAQQFGLPHEDVQISGAEAVNSVARWLAALDQPSIDGLNTFVVSEAVRRSGVKVALSGLGGDELFCGYSSFVDTPRLRVLMERASVLPVWARKWLARGASIGRPVSYRQKLIEIAETGSVLRDLYFQRRRVMSARHMAELGLTARGAGLARSFMPAEGLEGFEESGDAAADISVLEMRHYAGSMLLRDSDAMAMAHGLEIRVPFFDTGVLEAALPIPGAVRMPEGLANKHLLRRAFSDLLRPEVLGLTKRGFTLPIKRWMLGPLRGMCEQSLSDLKRTGLLDGRGIEGVWRAFAGAPESPIWTRAFALCVAGSYVSRVVEGSSGPASTPSGDGRPIRTMSAA